ncbi:hypothetical protein [Herpetosiphon llansteffanensis]|uniref:hypothetical protein n=1 Tax=Herpetosiphon llansteffanensis TaxID=2094568 RepID=UPI000D7CEC8F|nr:hypothetical protein [Herpetosiphon llansteffanensis]
MSHTLPAWHTELRRNQTLHQWGFRWHSHRRLSRTPARSDGSISLGSCPSLTTRHGRSCLVFDPSQPHDLWLDFCNDPEQPRLRCEPTFAALSQLYQRYFQRFSGQPGNNGMSMVAQVVQLRSQLNTLGLDSFLGAGYQQFQLFLGFIDEDGIVGLENSLVFNPWLALHALAMDSASGCGYSQYRTAYSGSILTMEFNRNYTADDVALCLARIAYQPVAEQANLQRWQMQNPESIAACLPLDVPFDVLGTFQQGAWGWWQTAEEAQALAAEGDSNATIIAHVLT